VITRLNVTIPEADRTVQELGLAAAALADTSALHAAVAAHTESWLKRTGNEIAKTEHATAENLGAKPTGHLTDAYNRIEATSSASAASLWIPGGGRLRAAFGSYTVRPVKKKWLTIPITADAYGKGAREIDGLKFIFLKQENTAMLVKPTGSDTYRPYYLLVKKATIPEDRNLIPFDQLQEEAGVATGFYIESAIQSALTP
jgi:hypothetical protein